MIDFTARSTSKGTLGFIKRALIFVEGQHKDSQGRFHIFDTERVNKYVDNTNDFLRSGGRLPLQKDHKKNQDNTLGDVEGELYTKVIEEEDLPNKKYKHLLGKLGVFTDYIVVKSKEAIQGIQEGLIKTLSPGLDPSTESFIEISATPTPAIIGPAFFSRTSAEVEDILYFNSVIDEDEIEDEDEDEAEDIPKMYSFEEKEVSSLEYLQSTYAQLTSSLFYILYSLYSSEEEELAANEIDDPISKSYEALDYAFARIEELFELVEFSNSSDTVEKVSGEKPKHSTALEYSRFSKIGLKPVGYIR